MLAIDPEDRAAHNGRLQVYLALGDEKAAAEARKAFLKYTIDESAQKWTNEFRRRHPAREPREQRHAHPRDARGDDE